ncbi:hypothetical protein [Streptomyces sp. NRRL F-5630]|uniref:hypothetical protein n=1 Tax=Streptomyces sp. NRRL F-5630 TaxID=1463864 RepID=UPI003D70EB5D
MTSTDPPRASHSRAAIPVQAFGERFRSYCALAADPRCLVSYCTLIKRIKEGRSPEEAALTSPGSRSRAVTAFGDRFASYRDLAADPRCLVSHSTLAERINNENMSPEEAALTSPGSRSRAVTAFGKRFVSYRDLAADPRCLVSLATLATRINAGKNPEEAALTPPEKQGRNGTPVTAFGEQFASYTALAADPRCLVSLATLTARINNEGRSPEEAALAPAGGGGVRLTAFGEEFASYTALAADPRCRVSRTVLIARIKAGKSPEEAACAPPGKRGRRRQKA